MNNMKDKTEGRPLVWSSFTLIVTFVCLSLVGLALVPLLPVKLSPSHDMPGLSVSFSMSGNSARVVETEVTSRLEGMLSRVSGIKNITSVSDNGQARLFYSNGRRVNTVPVEKKKRCTVIIRG